MNKEDISEEFKVRKDLIIRQGNSLSITLFN